MPEFTGERIIPGVTDVNLWNEHYSRYAFARQFTEGKRVLDAGCGSGYGAAMLAANARGVLGIDRSEEALDYARANFTGANVRFDRASCEALPCADGSIDLIAAFEVIEHLPEWPRFLSEARRVLAPDGLFLVSTPNKLYYAESRRNAGPNPFHVHEFEFSEFRNALAGLFPRVAMFAQNHAEALVFSPIDANSGISADMGDPAANAEEAHFFLAVCGTTLPDARTFVYLPDAANLLREREHHIALLEGELQLKSEWLEDEKAKLDERNREHAALVGMFAAQTAELEARNRWAQERDREAAERGHRVIELQDELADAQRHFKIAVDGYESKIAELESEHGRTVERAIETETRLTAELDERVAELTRCVELLHAAEDTVEERTHWALRAQAEAGERLARLRSVRDSKWMKFGRSLKLGPALDDV